MRTYDDPLLTAFTAFVEATVRRFAEAGLIDRPLTEAVVPDRRKVRCACVCDVKPDGQPHGFWRVLYEDEYGDEWFVDLIPFAEPLERGEVEDLVLKIVAENAEAAEVRAAATRSGERCLR